MYRGLVPQLCGVAPEKAIKMTTNDAVRNYFTDPKTGEIPFSGELIAGAAVSGVKMYRVILLLLILPPSSMRKRLPKKCKRLPQNANVRGKRLPEKFACLPCKRLHFGKRLPLDWVLFSHI